MGQYYKTVNVTKNQFVERKITGKNDFDFAKLTETAWIKNNSMGGLLIGLLFDAQSVAMIPETWHKLTNDNFAWGAWSGDVVVRAGDYDEDESLITNQQRNQVQHARAHTEEWSWIVNNRHESQFRTIPAQQKYIDHLIASQLDDLKWTHDAMHSNFLNDNLDTEHEGVLTSEQTERIDTKMSELRHTQIANEKALKDEFNTQKSRFLTDTVNLYDLCCLAIYKELSFKFTKSITTSKIYLVNYTKRQFVSMNNYLKQKCINNDGWIMHPLPLLIAKTNGVGGGDYNGINQQWVGYWAGDSIATSFFKPNFNEFVEILPFFTEDFKLVELIEQYLKDLGHVQANQLIPTSELCNDLFDKYLLEHSK